MVKEKLNLDLAGPGEEIVTITAPGGERAAVRVRRAAAPPERPAPRERRETAAATRPLRRPTLTGQHDSQATVTSIALYAECPRRYYLSRYLGFEPAPRGAGETDGASQPGASESGRQVHAILSGATVEATARAAGLSRRVLEKRVRKYLKHSALEEIRRVRTDQIARMLVETELPVSQIAETLGFEDVQHVARYFRAGKGLSPLAYRKTHGRKHAGQTREQTAGSR